MTSSRMPGVWLAALVTAGCLRASDPPPDRTITAPRQVYDECVSNPGPRSLAGKEDTGSLSTALLARPQIGYLQNFECDDGQCTSQKLHTTLKERLDICDDATQLIRREFAMQPLLHGRTCAAVVISPKHLLTSRHCCRSDDCAGKVAVFDYFAPDTGPMAPGVSYPSFPVSRVATIPNDDDHNSAKQEAPRSTYDPCSKLPCKISGKPKKSEGLVILETRECHNRPSVLCDPPASGETASVVSFGFPDNLPMVRAGPGELVHMDDDAITVALRHNDGNSGGPVFRNRSGIPALLGIAYAGGDAYVACPHSPEGGDCTDALECTETDCDHAYATRMTRQICDVIEKLAPECH